MKKSSSALLLAGLILWTGSAAAADRCVVLEKGMNRFRPPEFSAPVMWSKDVGSDTHNEYFLDAILLDDRSVIVGGYYEPATGKSAPQPLLMHLERRGKPLWTIQGKEDAHEDRIVALTRDQDVIIALSAARAKKTDRPFVRVMRYEAQGRHLGGFALSEGDGALEPVAISPVGDGNYYIAARYSNDRQSNQRFGVVYKVNKEGERQWRRAYMPGLITQLDAMHVLRNGDLLLAGALTAGDGRQSGWLVRTDAQGNLKWQQNYPRGQAGTMSAIAELPGDNGFVLAGTLWPIGGERTAGWIMRVNPFGERVWERMYVGADHYRGVDIAALDDGRVMAALSAKPSGTIEQGQYAHARIIALSGHGTLLEADSYADGNGLWPSRLLNVNGLPLLVGHIREIPPEPPAPKEGEKEAPVPPVTYDGWVAELQSLSPYDDPCAGR